MAAGGFCKLPNGTVVVALNLPHVADGTTGVRVLVHAQNRARALTRLRNLGLRAIYLRGNAAPPTPDEITAVLHHPDGLIWRTTPDNSVTAPELWHPIRALLRGPAVPVPPKAAVVQPAGGSLAANS
ncbi:hypothetical protein ABZ865_28155 [Streptomyces sp. NPDC047085]|uniref:hypothetical protein n=1 Tax=Streptomyces sp. NPDC047085 TaxID=3155140 RepID=UPI00340A7813